MKEFIEREAAIAEAEYGGNFVFVVPVTKIRNLPAADVVEVVRCGQCMNWDTAKLYCHSPAGMSWCGEKAAKEGFCCFGERRNPNDHP